MASEAQQELAFSTVDSAGSVTLFRYCNYDVPFWARPNRRAGRWHALGEDATQYWSMTPQAAWAELIRAENLTSEDQLELVRMPIWACRFPRTGLIDLTDPDAQHRHGTSEEQLTGDAWEPCQALGRTLRATYRGVVAPSAALPGHVNLTMFGPRRKTDWRRRPQLARTLPATMVAVGRPEPGFFAAVRRRADGNAPRLF